MKRPGGGVIRDEDRGRTRNDGDDLRDARRVSGRGQISPHQGPQRTCPYSSRSCGGGAILGLFTSGARLFDIFVLGVAVTSYVRGIEGKRMTLTTLVRVLLGTHDLQPARRGNRVPGFPVRDWRTAVVTALGVYADFPGTKK